MSGLAKRLTGLSAETVLADPEKIAYDFARRYGLICVLKEHRTVVSDGGERLYRNETGNSGMATGGSGDVLSGILGGLAAQARHGELSLFSVATLGVYLHGLCGDVAAAELGEYSLMAGDLVDALPKILRKISRS